MSDILSWFTGHWDALLSVVAILLSLAVSVTKLTPTTKDDEIVAKVEEVLKNLGVVKDPPPAA